MIDVVRIGGFFSGVCVIGGFILEGALSSVAKDAADIAGRCLAQNATEGGCSALQERMISYQYGALGTSFAGVLLVGAFWLTCHIIKERRIARMAV